MGSGPRRQQLLLKVSRVPDWGRRAIRLSLALIFFTTLGLTLWLVPESYRAEWGDEVVQSCNWAGATCTVVAASPLIGKVAQLSYERTLGTLTGGLLGFMVYDYGVLMLPEVTGAIVMVAAAAAVGFLSCYLSYKFKLDASMRLFVITFLIVTFGARGAGSRSALGVALLRTGGIIFGVLLFMALTIVILPKSATIESLREMKSGLKLLTELNALVWSSRREAAAVMKNAAAAARSDEAAAAAAATAEPQQQQRQVTGGGSSSSKGSQGLLQSFGLSRNSRSRTAAAAAAVNAQGYQSLADHDPEAGLLPAAAAAAGGIPVAASGTRNSISGRRSETGSSSSSKVSQLTQALRKSASRLGAPQTPDLDHWSVPLLGNAAGAGGAAAAKPQQQQQPPQGTVPSYESVLEQYEMKCEAVLTSVYQSMFKVKEHIGIADSEIYIYHFWGHYLFLPIFFNRGLVNWMTPNRWKLPKKQMDDLSTSVRVIARLLWTVHLDYSQGFDEVLSALPASARMNNVLEEVGQLTAAALGVLVEAFPNKDAIVVDSLNRLDVLVDGMLALSAAQHEALIRDLAANRQPIRINLSPATSTVPPLPTAAAASGLPAAAAAAASSMPVGTSDAASWQYSPRATHRAAGAERHQQQQQITSRQVAFVTTLDSEVPGDPDHNDPDHNDPDQHDLIGNSLLDMSPFEEVGPPIRSETPQIRSRPDQIADPPPDNHAAAAAASAAAGSSSLAEDVLGDLIFPLSDAEVSLNPNPPHASNPDAPGSESQPSRNHLSKQGLSQSRFSGYQPQSPSRSQGLACTPPAFNRLVSLHGQRAGSLSLGSKSRFKPYAVMAAVKLQTAAAHGTARSVARAAEAAAAAAASGGAAPLPGRGRFSADFSVDQARTLMRNLSTASAPDDSVARSAVAALQQQQQQGGGEAPSAADAAGAGGGESLQGVTEGEKPNGQNPVADMSFVKLMRWYSFQILMDELLAEMDELYCCVREVVQVLPHGL